MNWEAQIISGDIRLFDVIWSLCCKKSLIQLRLCGRVKQIQSEPVLRSLCKEQNKTKRSLLHTCWDTIVDQGLTYVDIIDMHLGLMEEACTTGAGQRLCEGWICQLTAYFYPQTSISSWSCSAKITRWMDCCCRFSSFCLIVILVLSPTCGIVAVWFPAWTICWIQMQVRYCTCTVVLLYSTVMYTSHKIHEFNRMAKRLMYRMKWMINFVHVLNHGSLALISSQNRPTSNTSQLPALHHSWEVRPWESELKTSSWSQDLGWNTMEPQGMVDEKWWKGRNALNAARIMRWTWWKFKMFQVALDWCRDGRLCEKDIWRKLR